MSAPHDYVGDSPPKLAPPGPNPVYQALRVVASLRVTVVLFALAMILVFFGTLAQQHASIETVMKDYFRSWLTWIDFRLISDFCKVFVDPEIKGDLAGGMPFPGGYLIGWAMFLNLLAAHIVRFKLTWKRSGIIMLHAGVIVLLAGEFLTGQFAVESRMSIREGESARYVFYLHEHELVVIDPTNAAHDTVISVPGHLITGAKEGEWISHPDLPFGIQRGTYFVNARSRQLKPGETPLADVGINARRGIEARDKSKGTDSDGRIDYPAVSLTFQTKDGKPLGTYLFLTASETRMQKVNVDKIDYEVTFRFKRSYRPYSVHLIEATHDVYAGTNTPKDYASTVMIYDDERGESGPVRIWMNHPHYYREETYYQSGLNTDEDGVKTTILQVVENPAWQAPYLACILVAAGMAFHFLLKLQTFLRRGGAR